MPYGPFTLDDFLGAAPLPGAIVGVGIDVSFVERVARAAQGKGFVRQVFSPAEAQAWAGDPMDAPSLARAFSLKEAFFKALGTGQRLDMLFHEIQMPPFAPEGSLDLTGRTLQVAQALGVRGIQASSSLSGGMAVGWVLLTG